jgi:hypothetical protein
MPLLTRVAVCRLPSPVGGANAHEHTRQAINVYLDDARTVSMLRTLLSVIGLCMVSIPRKIVTTAEAIAFENPGDATLREWTIPMARLEGIGYLLLVRRTGVLSSAVGVVLGLIGAIATVAPRQYLNFGLSLAYENSDDITVRSWVTPMTRVLGSTALVLTIASFRGADDE